jgi:catechol 2,3-dioxygenase-like lactoylglutathione lyase family enzyme
MDFHDEPDPAVPLVRLNHVSFHCASVEASVRFYQRVLGFELVKRPASLDFEGAW